MLGHWVEGCVYLILKATCHWHIHCVYSLFLVSLKKLLHGEHNLLTASFNILIKNRPDCWIESLTSWQDISGIWMDAYICLLTLFQHNLTAIRKWLIHINLYDRIKMFWCDLFSLQWWLCVGMVLWLFSYNHTFLYFSRCTSLYKLATKRGSHEISLVCSLPFKGIWIFQFLSLKF